MVSPILNVVLLLFLLHQLQWYLIPLLTLSYMLIHPPHIMHFLIAITITIIVIAITIVIIAIVIIVIIAIVVIGLYLLMALCPP